MTITLFGHVPAKKNRWGPRRGGGIMLAKDAAADIEALELQARIAWNNGGLPHGPLECPALRITLHVRNRGADRDNKLATILDVLQKAGILRNDNIAHCNGRLILEPAVCVGTDGREMTVIEIEPGVSKVEKSDA